MSWENDASGYLAELSRQPGARQPATMGEVWNSEWQRTALDTAGGLAGLYDDARGQLVSAIETASGQGITDYAASKGVKLGSFLTTGQDYEALAALADTLPDDKRKAVEPLKDIRLNAAKRAQKIEADAADIGEATYGLSAHATAFLSGIARQSIDPANLVAMAVTAPMGGRGGSLLSFIGREAGANAAAQAMVEPVIQPQRAELGLDAGFGRAAGNILEAGIGGAIIGGGLHLAGRGLRAMRGERPAEAAGAPVPAEGAVIAPEAAHRASAPDPAPAQPVVASRPIEQFAPDDFHAAGDLADRDHVIDLMSPDATAAGRFDHAAKVDEVAARIDSPQAARISEPHSLETPASWVIRDKTTKEVVMETFDAGRVDALNTSKYEAVPILEYLQSVNADIKSADAAAARIPVDPADMVTREMQPKAVRGRAAADPETWSLFEFIASKGGLKPDPELNAIFGTKGGPFVPGFGKLIRKGGRTLDDALTSAKEAGYLFDPQDVQGGALGVTIRDLLDVIDAETRGQKLYKPGRAKEPAIDDGQEAHAIIGALEKELFETGGGDIRVDNAIADRVVQIVRQEKETDLLSAYERAIMEDAERYEALAAARSQDAELGKIQGWDKDVWDADEPAAASRDGAADPGQRRQAGRTGQGDGGSDGPAPREPGDGAGASRQLGDPALAADAQRVLDEAGDIDITLINPDGTTRTVKASDALREVEEDAAAADALNACIVGAAEEAPF